LATERRFAQQAIQHLLDTTMPHRADETPTSRLLETFHESFVLIHGRAFVDSMWNEKTV
jgi:hypothetical protein